MAKLRRTMLFCPASNPKMLFTAMIYKPDCILFDLEDSVAYHEKNAARDLMVEALKAIDYETCEVFVRINPLYTEFGVDDVKALVPAGLTRIRLPMCEAKVDVLRMCALLDEVEEAHGIEKGTVKLQCAIETPLGVHNSLEIAQASDRIVSISFGAEDFTRTLGVDRTKEGRELFFARSQVVMNAKLAGVDAIDTVFADIGDIEGFEREVKDAKNLGFAGKSCVHPSQVSLVHDVFTPTKAEIDSAVKIIEASGDADIERGGVILVDGKMIDIPVIDKAKRVLELAVGAGVMVGGRYE